MRRRLHLLLPACALLFQVVPILFIRNVAWLTYGEPHCLPESSVWSVSLLGLALCAVTSTMLGGLGTYVLLTRSCVTTAVALIVLCCLPALIAGAVYLHAVLVFLTVV